MSPAREYEKQGLCITNKRDRSEACTVLDHLTWPDSYEFQPVQSIYVICTDLFPNTGPGIAQSV